MEFLISLTLLLLDGVGWIVRRVADSTWLGALLGAILSVWAILRYLRWRSSRIKISKLPPHEERARILTWVIPLRKFRFHHEPYRRESDYSSFIGREALCAEFLALLNNSQNSSGSYLVTGYRGVGKTSFVKKVLHDYADGRHHLGLSERYDLFGEEWMRVGNVILSFWGERLLRLHRRQTRRTHRRRVHGKPAPRFFWPPCTWVLVLPEIIRWVLYLGVVGVLAFAPPGFPWGSILVALGVAAVLLHQWSKHRLAILYPGNWWRWLVRPVVPIHINLGHERLDPKNILFGLIHVLRSNYREPFRLFSWPTVVRKLLFFIATLTLAFVLYDLFRVANKYTEALLQGALFHDHVATCKDLNELESCEKTSKEGGSIRDDSYESLYRLRLVEDPHEAAGESGGENVEILITPLLPGEDAKDEERTSSRIDPTYGTQATGIVKALDGDMNRARLLCLHLPVRELGLSQALYCAADSWLVDIYCHEYVAEQRDEAKPPLFQCPPRTNEPQRRIRLEDWLHFSLDKLISGLDEIARKLLSEGAGDGLRNEPRNKLDAVRPYQVLFLLVVLLLAKILVDWFGRGRVIRMLNGARERIVASDTVEVGAGGSWPLVGRRSRRYDPLDVRQAEALILDILEANRRIPRFLPRPDIVFVFDELDKINPIKGDAAQDADVRRGRSLNEAVRRRKVEVEELLSNLKNLITVAPCRFIFIAGREMMDANLADRSSNSHLYSSLFDKVMYVPSLLTDTSDENEEVISSMVEQYLCRRLLPLPIAYYIRYRRLCSAGSEHFAIGEKHHRCWNLQVYAAYVALLHEDKGNTRVAKDGLPELELEQQKLMCLLQDFVYYLTYRSGGNPKRLALQLESFVAPVSDNFLFDRKDHQAPSGPLLPTTNFLLRLPPSSQYEIQLISQIFLLFHGDISALIRKYGDKLAVATFSILDYLLKFHSLGFNSRDLERMPDFLDINRAPALPQLIHLLLERLLAPYLRKVDNGIYDYRFLLHFQREVVYISQFSEQELAAFNFTLDESIAIKQHFHDFRDEQLRLRGEMAPILWPESVNTLPEARRGGSLALPFIDVILGDLHNLDREYDQAQTEYRNAIDSIEPALAQLFSVPAPNGRGIASSSASSGIGIPTFSHFLLYLRTLLKSGLIYEQRRQYDQAAGSYLQARLFVEAAVQHWARVRPFSRTESQIYLFAQPYVSLAFLYAKQDASPERALQHMEDAHKVCAQLDAREWSPRVHSSEYVPFSQPAERCPLGILSVRLQLRRAELLLFRSDLAGAAHSFAVAARNAIELPARQQDDDTEADNGGDSGTNGNVPRLHLLGLALSGLGDAIAGLDLDRVLGHRNLGCFLCDDDPRARQAPFQDSCRRHGRDFDEADSTCCLLMVGISQAKDLLERFGDRRGTEVSLGELSIGLHLKLQDQLLQFLNDLPAVGQAQERPGADRKCQQRVELADKLRGRAVVAYALSALVYRYGGQPSHASLSLWKAAYMFAFGFSYWSQDGDRRGFFVDKIWPQVNELLFIDSWRNEHLQEQDDCRVHGDAMQAFHWAYRAQRMRLRKLRVDSEDSKAKKTPSTGALLKWIAPPLSQSMIVLGSFWEGFWRRDIDDAMNGHQVGIRSMGAFPVYPRILASFLKGRWRFSRAFPNLSELPDGQDSGLRSLAKLDSVRQQEARIAFRFLVDAAEDAEAFESGIELLNPPLGFIYYHLWLTLYAISRSKDPEILDVFRDTDEFTGERNRYFEIDYIGIKARHTLQDMLSRHGNDEGFFAYADKHCYLADAFSDPYVNGLWAVEAGLLPIARAMLDCLSRPGAKDGSIPVGAEMVY